MTRNDYNAKGMMELANMLASIPPRPPTPRERFIATIRYLVRLLRDRL